MFWSVPLCQKCLQTNMWMFFLDESNFMFGLFICQNEEGPRRAAFSLRCRQKLCNAKGFRASLRRPAREGVQEANRYALETWFRSLNVFARVDARTILRSNLIAEHSQVERFRLKMKNFPAFSARIRKNFIRQRKSSTDMMIPSRAMRKICRASRFSSIFNMQRNEVH